MSEPNLPSPLPALTLGLDHGLTERIRRLTMSPTTHKGRLAGASLAAIALLASAPLSIAETDRAPDMARADLVPAPTSVPEIEFNPAPAPAPMRLVQADAATGGQTPVILQIMPDTSANFERALQARVESGSADGWRYEPRKEWAERFITINANTGGVPTADIRQSGQSPRSGVAVDAKTLRAAAPLLEECRRLIGANPRLSVFPHRFASDSGLFYGEDYIVSCYPGGDTTRERRVTQRNLDGLMASTRMPEKYRNNIGGAMYHGIRAREFEARTPNPTRAQYAQHCVSVRMDRQARFPMGRTQTADQLTEYCNGLADRKAAAQ